MILSGINKIHRAAVILNGCAKALRAVSEESFKTFNSIMWLLLLAFALTTSAQNTMQINHTQGLTNDTLLLSLAIANDEEFISFQCDVMLPDGFGYIPESINLTPRAVDHVVNVSNTGINSIRILSYSLNNTPFLLDSGAVAQFMLATPSKAGDYFVDMNNGIIGNAASVNILDSLIAGKINLSPIGIAENDDLSNKINCFPNPFQENLNIQLDIGFPKTADLKVFDLMGRLLSNHKLELNKTEMSHLSFNANKLLGPNPTPGKYIFHFGFQYDNQNHTIVKKIHFR